MTARATINYDRTESSGTNPNISDPYRCLAYYLQRVETVFDIDFGRLSTYSVDSWSYMEKNLILQLVNCVSPILLSNCNILQYDYEDRPYPYHQVVKNRRGTISFVMGANGCYAEQNLKASRYLRCNMAWIDRYVIKPLEAINMSLMVSNANSLVNITQNSISQPRMLLTSPGPVYTSPMPVYTSPVPVYTSPGPVYASTGMLLTSNFIYM